MSPSPSVGDEGIDERGACYGWRARRRSIPLGITPQQTADARTPTFNSNGCWRAIQGAASQGRA